MNNTTPSNPPTGAGELSALVCAGCGSELLSDWVYACDRCCAGWMRDDNFRMHGESDNGDKA
ncbi:protein NinF [Pantoea sp. S18]|uniref:protein NinF n=1 Tax=Pantoea sp. S18 TaxID=3019892 RepID=UPI002B20417A|nr:protein NinF [Pantoea sp. S18]MEA5104706.1 protein NinF [Pantoea sp. S18]